MRNVKFIVVHCTAGPLHQPTDEIRAYWVNVNGWKNPGYHREISADGTVEILLPYDQIANGVKGYNEESVHLSTKGGIDAKGQPFDNRTPGQKASLIVEIKAAKRLFPNAVVVGHRDFSTDQNGNGIIERWELIKSCPSYDVRDWLKEVGLEEVAKPSGIVYKLNFPLVKDSFVGRIQRALMRKNYHLIEDNVFGKDTSNALMEFQRKSKVTVSGIADDKTISLLGIR